MVGQTVGQYKIVEQLARGGMGLLYRAVDETLGREVALKILDGDVEDEDGRFRTEATCLARLGHAGIATVYELLEHNGRPVMAMELLQGPTIQDILDQVGVFAPDRAAAICIEVLNALDHAHAAGIVHRDLKPSNLMMTSAGVIKIMDFGIARVEGAVHLTHVGFSVGSPAYMAPEQVEGRPIDARTDLYAMGVVFYRLLSAELPFKGDTPFAMAQSQVNDAPVPIEHARPDAPLWVSGIITRALAKNPAERFQSARDFRDALAHATAGVPGVAALGLDGPTEVMARPDFDVAANAAAHAVAGATPNVPRVVMPRRITTWVGAAIAAAAFGGILWFGLPSTVAPSSPGAPPLTAAIAPALADTVRPTDLAPAKPVVAKPATPSRRSPVAAIPEPVAPILFDSVKLLVLTGPNANVIDVVLSFSDSELIAQPTGHVDSVARVPYRGMAFATYVYARDPQWNAQASASLQKIDIPGLALRRRHWLVVQTESTHAILQLDNANWFQVLKAFEARTGLPVARPHGEPNPRQAGRPNK